MGINGLLPVLKSIREQKHVKTFARTRVGVDVYAWLHRGVFSCASKVCRGLDTTLYVDYCMHRVRMLLHFDATPVLVFDGAALPMKAATHAERRARREEALRHAERAAAAGDMRKAEDWYQKACPVTPEMARKVIRECRKINVECVVAPYEADAQLAWMVREGYVESVITEDSDLLVYGARRVFYKMTKNGDGDLYEMKNLPAVESISMNNFTEDMFVLMCVCAGCDFFKGVQGLGIRKAHALVKKFRSMPRLVHAIRHDARYPVSRSFTEDFSRACLVFRHQTVYDVQRGEHVHLRKLDKEARAMVPSGVLALKDEGGWELGFLGRHRDKATATAIAQGRVHPATLKEYAEPLDVVQRPVTKKRRPQSFESSVKPWQPSSRVVPKSMPGFRVHPVSSNKKEEVQAPLRFSQNLKQRLAAGPRTFNPRRVAAGFKASNALVSSSHPKFASNSSVWNRFHKGDSKVTEETVEDEKKPEIGKDETERKLDAGEEQSQAPPSTLPSGRDELTHVLSNRSESGGVEEKRAAKRARLCAPASHRVEAINKAVSRFAADETVDKSLKFSSISEVPPSPDRYTYALFEKAEADMSEDSHQDCEGAPVKSNKESPGRKQGPGRNESNSSEQVRVSRFFPMSAIVSKTESNLKAVENLPVLNKSPKRGLLALSKTVQKTKSINSINRFRRGASGNKISTVMKKA